MKTITLDVRERIVKCYDRQKETRAQVAQWFGISLGMVKKLLQQRRRIGDLAPQHHRAGRKPKILHRHRQQFRFRPTMSRIYDPIGDSIVPLFNAHMFPDLGLAVAVQVPRQIQEFNHGILAGDANCHIAREQIMRKAKYIRLF